MILDGALQFTGTAGNVAAMTDSPTTGAQFSTNIIDLVAARDMGIGDDPALKLTIQITGTFTVGTSLDVQLQGAPDNGVGQPGVYVAYWDSGVVVEANLLAGEYLANVDLPRVPLATPYGPSAYAPLPRFYRLAYTSVGTHAAGSALFGALTLDEQRQVSYRPGVVINN